MTRQSLRSMFFRSTFLRGALFCSAACLTALAAVPASAAISVIGKGAAQSCFQAAEFGLDTADGIAACTSALENETLSPHDRASTYVNRGILKARDNPESALLDYDQGLEIEKDLAEAYVDRGAALLSLKRYGAALADIDRGIALHVNRPHIAYYDRAVAHEGLGDIRAAYEDYKKAVELAPDFALAKQQLQRFKVVTQSSGQPT